MKHISDIELEFPSRLSQRPMVYSGLYDLDSLVGAIGEGELVTIAGRSQETARCVALRYAEFAVTRQRIPVHIFSSHNRSTALLHSLVSGRGKIPFGKLTSNVLTDDERNRIERVSSDFRGFRQLRIHPERRLSSIEGIVRDLETSNAIVIIDPISHITANLETKRRFQPTECVTSYVSRRLKRLAHTTGVRIFVLHNILQRIEKFSDPRPVMADVPAYFEQESDCVLLLHRDDLINRHSFRHGIVDIEVVKRRGGPTGIVHFLYLDKFRRAENVSIS